MQGTTTACYFASLYTKASVILGEEAGKIGQRALIGKISMNENRDDGYYENTEESIKNINRFIEEINELNVRCNLLINIILTYLIHINFNFHLLQNPLIKPIITPRFALSCDMTLMKQLGKLAKEKSLHVQVKHKIMFLFSKYHILCISYFSIYKIFQSHVSENLDEIKAVKNKFPECSSYSAVYDAAGLLTNKVYKIIIHNNI